MPAWEPHVLSTHPLDFRLVCDSFVQMFWRPAVLGDAIGWLRAHGYDVVEFDAGSWSSAADMFGAVARGFDFPDYFGAIWRPWTTV